MIKEDKVMPVVKTYVHNNKTIRVWEESRGIKTLTRKFYVKYRLMKITHGQVNSNVYDTLSQANKARKEWMDSIGKDWRRYNEFCTHIEGTECRCFDNHVYAKCYICAEGGDIISEVIK